MWVSLKRRAVKIQGWRLELPGFRLSLVQMLIGAGDVCAGAGVLFVLLPGGHGISFETFLAVYVLAVMLGVASHSPGGLGVFEATILLALSSYPARAGSRRAAALPALLLSPALRDRAGDARDLRNPQPARRNPASLQT